MYCEKSWTSRHNVIRGLSVAPYGFYRLGVKSEQYGITFIESNPRNLIFLLLQLPTKNLYFYEEVSNLAQ